MCCGVPYATAAKFCFPDRVAIAFVGDGAMQMLGINGLITIAKYWREWADPRLIIVVLNNRDLNMVTWELRALGGSPEDRGDSERPRLLIRPICGDAGSRSSPNLQPRGGRTGLGGGAVCRPSVRHRRHVDPNVLAVPPHVTMEQTKNYLAAILKGDREAAKTVWQSFKQAFT